MKDSDLFHRFLYGFSAQDSCLIDHAVRYTTVRNRRFNLDACVNSSLHVSLSCDLFVLRVYV